MKGGFLVLFCCACSLLSSGQQKTNLGDSFAVYFNEIKIAAVRQTLWIGNLYGPILFVDPGTRRIYANEADSGGVLESDGKIFIGSLPLDINIANTSLRWNGKDWAMIMLPLPLNKTDRIDLLAHELFHRMQPSLGFPLYNPDNDHLDKKDGRVYLRLELEALIKAVHANSRPDIDKHLRNALAFRAYRRSLFPGSDSTENMLEINEGLASYTGLMISRRKRDELLRHLDKSRSEFIGNPSFVRSFAYQTIPIYGYLLEQLNQGWNQEIAASTDLTSYFRKALFPRQEPGAVADTLLNRKIPYSASVFKFYGGSKILAEEDSRETKMKLILQQYRKRFIDDPHFEIYFEHMNVSYDPRNLMPIEGHGTVYPTIRITDNWGILTVEDGALMSSQWNKITVTNPLSIVDNLVEGEGWKLILNQNYRVQKDAVTNRYELVKGN